jgi:hypothetical protein
MKGKGGLNHIRTNRDPSATPTTSTLRQAQVQVPRFKISGCGSILMTYVAAVAGAKLHYLYIKKT